MNSFFLNVFMSILSLIVLMFLKEETMKNISYGILGTAVFNIANLFLENKQDMWINLQSKTVYRNKNIRFSISYLYRIKIGSKYFLIKSNRIENLFQPVGGVYKRLPESIKIFSKLKILDDNCLAIDDKSEFDLRVRVPGKNVINFLKWFYSEEDREVSHWREFCEELIRKDILNPDQFPHFQYRKIRQEKVKLKWSDFHQSYEYKIFDVLEPIFNKEQKEAFRDLMDSKNDNFKWVEESLINSLGHDSNKKGSNFRIGDQTKYII